MLECASVLECYLWSCQRPQIKISRISASSPSSPTSSPNHCKASTLAAAPRAALDPNYQEAKEISGGGGGGTECRTVTVGVPGEGKSHARPRCRRCIRR